LSPRVLYTLYANAVCSTLSLDSRPTYPSTWYVAQGVKVGLMFGNEGITLWSIPASARAVYAPRENPFWKKVSDRVEKHVPKWDKRRNRRGKVYRLHGNSA
jgi:hypothetical protein